MVRIRPLTTLGAGFTACYLLLSGITNAFVGQMAIGLGEMDQEIGRIQTEFSGDVKFESEEFTGTGHVYYQPGKVRDELTMGSDQTVFIRRLDTNKFYMLMPMMPGAYMEIDPDKGDDKAPEYELISREVMGTETVNGIPTTKYKSVYQSKDGKFGGFTWYTDDNIAVKAFMIHESKGEKHRFKFEFTRLERGAQPDDLFELPPGAKAFNPGAMMGMGMSQADMQEMQRQAEAASKDAEAPASQSSSKPVGEDDGGFVTEVADEAQKTAEDTAKDETLDEVRNSVKKGIGKLFGR